MADTAQELEHEHHFQIYNRHPLTLTRGKGSRVWDAEGNEYIDALAGIAVNSLGHCHPKVVNAIQRQAERLIHASNFYYTQPMGDLAEILTRVSGMDRVFFCNSGGEAVEGAVKLARKYGHDQGKEGNIISMENCFHGRTLGTISLGKKKYWKVFEPVLEGFEQVPFNDPETLEETMNDDTVAVIIEPIQGEGGIIPAEKAFLKKARELCDRHGALLILDEIQCGVGRAGAFYTFQRYGVTPDILTTAKALGSGFPIGAFLAKDEVSQALSPGSHGTTYGGNPVGCAAALTTLRVMQEKQVPAQALKKGKYAKSKLREAAEDWDAIRDIRGEGLMIGVDLNFNGKPVVATMREKGVLSNCTSDTVIRLVPPLTIPNEDLNTVVDVLIESIKEVEKES